MITRRQLLLVASACVLGATNNRGVQAQTSGKVYRVGILSFGKLSANDRDVAAFLERLGQLGYVEGRNLQIELRAANRQADRLPALAAELVRLDVDVIVTITTPAARAAKAATTTIPIVMAGSAAPVEEGLVASLARPGGNVTGVTNNPGQGFVVKQLQLLKEAAPRISRVAILMTTDTVENRSLDAMRAVETSLGVISTPVIIDSPTQPDVAALLIRARADALYVFPNSINRGHGKTISDFATANRLPLVSIFASPLVAGADSPPAWAYPIAAADLTGRDDGVPRRVPNSSVSYTLPQWRDRFMPRTGIPGITRRCRSS